jgi:hypothetical protein
VLREVPAGSALLKMLTVNSSGNANGSVVAIRHPGVTPEMTRRRNKSLFAPFSSEKEDYVLFLKKDF